MRVSLVCFKVPEEYSFGHVLAQEREDLAYLACLVSSESQYIRAEGPFPKKLRTKSWPAKAAHIFIIVPIDSGILRQIPASSDRHSAKGVNSMVTALCFVSEV